MNISDFLKKSATRRRIKELANKKLAEMMKLREKPICINALYGHEPIGRGVVSPAEHEMYRYNGTIFENL